MKKIWNEIKDYIYIILVVMLIRTFIVTPAIVDGPSMEKNFYNNDLVLINKFIYYFKDIERFDVVVIKNDKTQNRIIKRVIALPGETVTYVNNNLFINGELIETDIKFVKDTIDFEYTTKEGEYFVLGDNRPASADSRYYGPFTKKDILGKVNIRLYPFKTFGKVK